MLSVPRHIRVGACAPAVLMVGGALAVVALPAPAHAQALNASTILAVAQRASVGDAGGQCKVFVNTTVASASRGRIALSKYHDGYADAGAVEVPLEQAGPGDIIQVTPAGSTDATAESLWRRGGPLHSAIVEVNHGNGRFRVIDSNWNGNERVARHEFAPLQWAASKGGGIVKVWRFGAGAPRVGAGVLGDGSFIRVAGTEGIYRIAGAAPLPILSWAAVGGEGPVTEVDWATLNNFAPFPVDGTVLQSGPGGSLYVVNKGVPRALPAGATPGRTPVVVDPLTIANAGGPGAFSRLRNVAFSAAGVPTRTVLAPPARPVRRGAHVVLTVRVAGGSARTGTPVGRCTLQRRAGTRWVGAGNGVLGANGACRIRVRITTPTVLRAGFIGATGWRSSTGRPVAVRVA